jgi:hypothetical protein
LEVDVASAPSRTGGNSTAIVGAAVLAAISVGASPVLAQDRSPSPFALDILRGAISDNPQKPEAKGREPPAPKAMPNDTEPAAGAGQVTLVAQVTEDGQRIDRGVVWRVYAPRGADGKPRLLGTYNQPFPILSLTPGDYLINAAFGRANVTRKIAVAATTRSVESFPLNLGLLKVTLLLASNQPAPAAASSFEVLSDDRDQLGQRSRVIAAGRAGQLYRLNSGLYQIVAQYGDANARVEAELTVEPGKLTETTVVLQAARVTFRLVTRLGGEAMADTQWTIVNRQGDLVKESAGALPSHLLAPGTYTVSARSQGRSWRRTFAVRAGQNTQIEVLMQ